MSTASSSSVTGGEKWFDKLPKPQSSPKSLGVDEQHSLLHDSSSDSVIVVDVRRTDIEVGLHYRLGDQRDSLYRIPWLF